MFYFLNGPNTWTKFIFEGKRKSTLLENIVGEKSDLETYVWKMGIRILKCVDLIDLNKALELPNM